MFDALLTASAGGIPTAEVFPLGVLVSPPGSEILKAAKLSQRPGTFFFFPLLFFFPSQGKTVALTVRPERYWVGVYPEGRTRSPEQRRVRSLLLPWHRPCPPLEHLPARGFSGGKPREVKLLRIVESSAPAQATLLPHPSR